MIAVFRFQIRKAIGRADCTPLMASEVFDLPRASDGAGYDDHGNDDYRSGQGNEAGCGAEGHCQKFQFKGKVLEMQA
jgi:hypothetical protein